MPSPHRDQIGRRFLASVLGLSVAASAFMASAQEPLPVEGSDAAVAIAPELAPPGPDAGAAVTPPAPVLAPPPPPPPQNVAPVAPPEHVAPRVPPPLAEPATIDVTVRHRSEAERMRRSAEAVSIVETKDARRMTADLGEVLARTQGVAVQREGGLGSNARFSLNGLTDDQIRFFLDGVPLELAGFPFGLGNVPVNLVERVEIFRGVVPVRFGADALGGAVNLVSEGTLAPRRVFGSFQAGSFGTYRLTAGAQRLHEPSGWFTRATAFLDRADNDYPMKLEVPDERGRPSEQRVYRFHDGYRAVGGNLETGFVDRKWADRLLLRVFVSDYAKDLQSDLLMANVYGDATRDELTTGATLRYEHTIGAVAVSALAGYAWDEIAFRDVGTCVYNWYGRCGRQRAQPGEIIGRAQDQRFWTHGAYARLNADWQVAEGHNLRLSLSPSLTARSAESRGLAPGMRDPLDLERDLYGLVSGLEYRLALFGDRLENVLFAKDYLQVLRAEELITNSPAVREVNRTEHRGGVGDSLRFTFSEWIYGKTSYEWATRLPRADEIFGNGWPVLANTALKPELSHNLNLELDATTPASRLGTLHGNANGFMRRVERLIVLVPQQQTASYQNVANARSAGIEAVADWTSPGNWVVLAGNATYVDFRNISADGGFAKQKGERIPNRPWLFANGSAKLQVRELFAQRDELSLQWATRYMHGFYRNWQGLGDPATKLQVPAQVVHALGLVYVTRRGSNVLTMAAEVQNLTNAEVYDVFGVPRPGRAFYFKTTASL